MATAIYFGLTIVASATHGNNVTAGWYPVLVAVIFDAAIIYWFLF